MYMKKIISIIIPIFNTAPYLDRCIGSVCAQTYHNLQIILVDDGSTDGSGEICDRYAGTDSRIKVIHKENGGLVSARKAGLRIADGEYVAYVDGDDWIEPDMFEKMYDKAVTFDVDVIMCGHYEDMEGYSKKVIHRIEEGCYDKVNLLKDVYPKMIVNGAFFEWGIFPAVWGKLFRREHLVTFQMMVDERINMGEDAACVYPCLLNVESIYIMHECFYHYIQRAGSMIKKKVISKKEKERFSVLYRSVLGILDEYKDVFDLREQWKEYVLFLMVPRADYLYDRIDELDFLFPFSRVKKDSDVIIYGMGTYGQMLYEYLEHTGFCKVIATVDQNYLNLQKQGLPVIAPEEIENYDFDSIVIANSFAKSADEIYKFIGSKVCKEKIHRIDVKLIGQSTT